MKAIGFIQTTTQVLAEFLQSELKGHSGIPQVTIYREPPTSQPTYSEEPRGNSFFGIRRVAPACDLYLLPYHTRRTEEGRTREKVIRNIQRDGRTVAVATAGSERYTIYYMVLGPSVVSDVGQMISSCFISLFLDHTKINCVVDDSHETIKLVEVFNEHPDHKGVLQQHQLNLQPLYIFAAEVSVETGTIVAEDTRVISRVIKTDTFRGGR